MRITIQFFALVAGLALAGCSTYQARWKAARDSTGGRISPNTGAYAGRWESTRLPGTGGDLWCILSEGEPGIYRAEFKATWHGVFRSEHVALLKMTGPSAFRGDATIHAFIGSGTYSCTGELKRDALSATYDATYDAGQFVLTRAAGTRKTK